MFLLLERHHARIFGGLRRVASIGGNRRFRFVSVCILGVGQRLLGVGERLARVLVGVGTARDSHCVARLEEFQRSAWIDSEYRVFDTHVARPIGIATEQLIAELNLLCHARGIRAQHIF